ncbi:hypothetical protein RRG08_049410, partial [Elysia crispata]
FLRPQSLIEILHYHTILPSNDSKGHRDPFSWESVKKSLGLARGKQIFAFIASGEERTYYEVKSPPLAFCRALGLEWQTGKEEAPSPKTEWFKAGKDEVSSPKTEKCKTGKDEDPSPKTEKCKTGKDEDPSPKIEKCKTWKDEDPSPKTEKCKTWKDEDPSPKTEKCKTGKDEDPSPKIDKYRRRTIRSVLAHGRTGMEEACQVRRSPVEIHERHAKAACRMRTDRDINCDVMQPALVAKVQNLTGEEVQRAEKCQLTKKSGESLDSEAD